MSSPHDDLTDLQELRLRALARLNVRGSSRRLPSDAAAALGVLHQLVSSPSTVEDALTLLHELQVHQVELDMQAEELRSSRVELEADLRRRTELYDHAPVGCFAIAEDTTLHDLNLLGAKLLGLEREALLGCALAGFLTPASADALHALLARVSQGQVQGSCPLELARRGAGSSRLHASACAEPAGQGFLVAILPGQA